MYASLFTVGIPINYTTAFLQIIPANAGNFLKLLRIIIVVAVVVFSHIFCVRMKFTPSLFDSVGLVTLVTFVVSVTHTFPDR
jgi:predicted neutral ceramidase superfamily lipid hydrolase